MRKHDAVTYRDAIRGSLAGGGIGDALGYPVEFESAKAIFKKYGEDGITSYEYSFEDGLAVVSDDTQMTMFTATGVLAAYTEEAEGKKTMAVRGYMYHHYLDWLFTQVSYAKPMKMSWLQDLSPLYVRRAPGGTCLHALQSGECGTVEDPINHSKGCGGVMRVAPIALYAGKKFKYRTETDCETAHRNENAEMTNFRDTQEYETLEQVMEIDMLGAEAAAITHGHPLGYIPAAALVHVIRRCVFPGCILGDTLADITAECRMAMEQLFEAEPYLPAFLRLMDKAVELSGNDRSDLENIREIGEGWVGDEAFAIALYCALRYPDDFSKAVTAAVNHSGDSDSTGAIAGNIVGALVGYEQIDEKWKKNLEFRRELLELADDLWEGCPSAEEARYEAWMTKYAKGKRWRT